MTLQHGHDGCPPVFEQTRDLYSRDRLTGQQVRERVDGPTNINHSRVKALHARKRLTDRQAAAASRYQDDWQLAQIMPMASTASGTRSGGIAHSTLPDAKLDAMRRWGRARAAMGARCAAAVDLVALENMTVEIAANCLRVHHQKVAGWLEAGLDLMADHYKLASREL